MLVWKLWTVYTGMFAVTAILSCVIKIRGLFKSTKCGRLKMSNLKLSQPGVKNGRISGTTHQILTKIGEFPILVVIKLMSKFH